MEICSTCLTPRSRPRVVFIDGRCNACINSDKKKTINWKKREEEFLIKLDEMIKFAKKIIILIIALFHGLAVKILPQ